MATITLKDGDFGGGVTVTVGETALYLPDRARPGLNEMVPLTAIAEIESLGDDRTGQLKQAAKLGARGFLITGNPLGLATGIFAVTKVKNVEFAVRLEDGRRFVAVTDAGTLAHLRAASRTPLIPAGEDAEAAARADAVIAKYLGPDAQPLEPRPEREAPVSPPTPRPEAAADQAAAPPQDAPASPEPLPGPRVFGRPGVS